MKETITPAVAPQIVHTTTTFGHAYLNKITSRDHSKCEGHDLRN